MKAKDKMFIESVVRKVSGQGNEYYLVNAVESLEQLDEKGEPIKKNWPGLFYKPIEGAENPINFIGKMAVVVLNFYVYERKHNGNTYHDVKTNILLIENL
jgi:hypothetical protein